MSFVPTYALIDTVSTLCLTQHSIGASLSPGRLRFPHKLKRLQTASLPCHLHLHLLLLRLSNYSEPLLCISFFSKDQQQSTSTNQWKWLLFPVSIPFLAELLEVSKLPIWVFVLGLYLFGLYSIGLHMASSKIASFLVAILLCLTASIPSC